MGKSTRADGVVVPGDGRGLVSPAGAVLLRETMRAAVLARAACQPGRPGAGRRGRPVARERSSRTWPQRSRPAANAWPPSRCRCLVTPGRHSTATGTPTTPTRREDLVLAIRAPVELHAGRPERIDSSPEPRVADVGSVATRISTKRDQGERTGAPPAGITMRVGISQRTQISGSTLRRPGRLYLCRPCPQPLPTAPQTSSGTVV